MKKIRKALDSLLNVLAGTCFLAMTILTCWQVFTRFVLKNPSRLNPLGQKLLNCFGELVALIFSAAILIYGGTQINALAMGQMTSSLGVAVGVFYILLPICGAFSVVYTILNIMDIWSGKQEEGKVE